jgi:hypothetical protein
MASQQYHKLIEEDFEIRLLTVLPSEDFLAPIECTFRTVALAQGPSPKYKALSYTWGDAHNTSEISLNGISRQVTVNLASALRHLRDTENETVLWADAICINQQDLEERDMQVFIMSEIYRDAEEVIVWLGEESEDSEFALDMLNRWAWWGQHRFKDVKDLPFVDWGLEPFFNEPAKKAVKSLLQRPYWRRLWVLQEVVLAKTVQVVCGHRWLPFETFVQANSAWERLKKAVVSIPSAFGMLTPLYVYGLDPLERMIKLREEQRRVWNILSSGRPSGALPFLDLLMSCEHLKSSNPRDRIYGLLGLGMPATNYNQLVRPSYSKTVEAVFCEVARALVMDDESLRVISLACNSRKSNDQALLLPSWVPNWTCEQYLAPMYLYRRNSMEEKPNRVNIMQHVRFSPDCRVLWAEGVIYDTVSVLRPSWSLEYETSMETFPETLRNYTLPNGMSMMQAFFQTISLNSDFATGKPLWVSSETSMIQAIQFLKRFVPNSPSAKELKDSIMDLMQSFFGELRPDLQSFIGRFAEELGKSENERATTRQEGVLLYFELRSFAAIRGREFFETENGTLGLGPPGAMIGDRVCFLIGYPGFFVLQPIEDHYVLKGECSLAECIPGASRDLISERLGSLNTFEIH